MENVRLRPALEQAVALLERMISAVSSDADFSDENYAKSVEAVLSQAYDALDNGGD